MDLLHIHRRCLITPKEKWNRGRMKLRNHRFLINDILYGFVFENT